MRDANEAEAALYVSMVKVRNGEGLRQVVNVMHPWVLWGAVTRTLSSEEREWIASIF